MSDENVRGPVTSIANSTLSRDFYLLRLGEWAEKYGIPAMTAMVSACTRQNLDVEYEAQGGFAGQPMNTLARVSLLDRLKQALSALPKPKEVEDE